MRHVSNWIEIPAHDLARATTFYEIVLETTLVPMTLGPLHYALFPAQNRYNAGALVQGEGYVAGAQGPLVYLDAEGRLDAMLARVGAAGGAVLLPKTFVSEEAGEIALIQDSEGNRIGLQSAVPKEAASPVTDAQMNQLLSTSAPSQVFLLRRGPRFEGPEAEQLQWEHARNMITRLRAGQLGYVCALMDGSDVLGFGTVSGLSREAAARMLEADPAVRAGRFTFELLSGLAFDADELTL